MEEIMLNYQFSAKDWEACDLPFYPAIAIRYYRDWDKYPCEEDKFRHLFQAKMEETFTAQEVRQISSSSFLLPEKLEKRYYDVYESFHSTTEVASYKDHLNKIEAEWDEKENLRVKDIKTFCGNGLNKPGTLIKLSDGSIHLIGSVIPSGCMEEGESDFGNLKEIPKDARVVGYKQIIDLDSLQKKEK